MASLALTTKKFQQEGSNSLYLLVPTQRGVSSLVHQEFDSPKLHEESTGFEEKNSMSQNFLPLTSWESSS